ncbi:MAG: helix-turn-helix transcriptional regulator [Myxococcales bacterium]|nr:helix-turn-helix transcriptional regulator [Myxococcales bacterium]
MDARSAQRTNAEDEPAEVSGDRRKFVRAGVTIGEFVCRPASGLWARENHVGAGHIIVFPRYAVEIEHIGRAPVVADTNHVMLYNAGQTYRRRLLDARGDEAVFFAVPAALLAEILRSRDPGVVDRLDAPFPFVQGPVSSREYLHHARLFQALVESTSERDTLELDERVLELVTGTLLDVYTARGPGEPRSRARARTRRLHRDQVHELRRVIALRLLEPRSLAELAEEVGLSPYHAARIFRRYTGASIHGYRTQLRLRSSLPMLARGHEGGLTGVALELGFSSHSHFTTAFRRAFGLPPSAAWARAPSASRELP